MTSDDPTVITHLFDAWSYFHLLLRFEIEVRVGLGVFGTVRALARAVFPELAEGRRTSLLLVAVGDTTTLEVVRCQFDLDFVTGEDADVVHPHFAGDVCK